MKGAFTSWSNKIHKLLVTWNELTKFICAHVQKVEYVSKPQKKDKHQLKWDHCFKHRMVSISQLCDFDTLVVNGTWLYLSEGGLTTDVGSIFVLGLESLRNNKGKKDKSKHEHACKWNFAHSYLEFMIGSHAEMVPSVLLFFNDLICPLFKSCWLQACIYPFLHPVQHEQLVALKEQRLNRNYFLHGRKENYYACIPKFLVASSFKVGEISLVSSVQFCWNKAHNAWDSLLAITRLFFLGIASSKSFWQQHKFTSLAVTLKVLPIQTFQ